MGGFQGLSLICGTLNPIWKKLSFSPRTHHHSPCCILAKPEQAKWTVQGQVSSSLTHILNFSFYRKGRLSLLSLGAEGRKWNWQNASLPNIAQFSLPARSLLSLDAAGFCILLPTSSSSLPAVLRNAGYCTSRRKESWASVCAAGVKLTVKESAAVKERWHYALQRSILSPSPFWNF